MAEIELALAFGAWQSLSPVSGRMVDSTVQVRSDGQTAQIRGAATAAIPIGNGTSMFALPTGLRPSSDTALPSSKGTVMARTGSPISPAGWTLQVGETIVFGGSWPLS